MTDDEVDKLEQRSIDVIGRKNKSRIVRKIIREYLDLGPDLLESEMTDFRHAVRQLSGVARNLNQLTAYVHSDASNLTKVTPEYLDRVIKHVNSLSEELKRYVKRTKDRLSENNDE